LSSSISTTPHRTSEQKSEDEHGFLPTVLSNKDYHEDEDGALIVSNFLSTISQCDKPHCYQLLSEKNRKDSGHGYFVKQLDESSNNAKDQPGKHALPPSHRQSSSSTSFSYYILPTGLLASSQSSSSHSHVQSQTIIVCDSETDILNAASQRRLEYILGPTMIFIGMIILVLLSMALVEVMDRLWWRTMVPDEEQPHEDDDEYDSFNKSSEKDYLIGEDIHNYNEQYHKTSTQNSSETRDLTLSASKQEVLVPWTLYSIPENQPIGADIQEIVRQFHVYKPTEADPGGQEALFEEEEGDEEDTSNSGFFHVSDSDSDDDYLESFPVL
jgi:hypothetical protein